MKKDEVSTFSMTAAPLFLLPWGKNLPAWSQSKLLAKAEHFQASCLSSLHHDWAWHLLSIPGRFSSLKYALDNAIAELFSLPYRCRLQFSQLLPSSIVSGSSWYSSRVSLVVSIQPHGLKSPAGEFISNSKEEEEVDAIGCMDASRVNGNNNDKVQSYLAKPLKRHFAKGQLFTACTWKLLDLNAYSGMLAWLFFFNSWG